LTACVVTDIVFDQLVSSVCCLSVSHSVSLANSTSLIFPQSLSLHLWWFPLRSLSLLTLSLLLSLLPITNVLEVFAPLAVFVSLPLAL